MKQNTFCDANSPSASQETAYIVQNLFVRYCVHSSLPLAPARVMQSMPSHPISLRSILALSSLLCLVFQVDSFHEVSPLKVCMHFLCPHTCHTLYSSIYLFNPILCSPSLPLHQFSLIEGIKEKKLWYGKT